MFSVQLEDRENAEAFAAWVRDKPYEYLRRESWPLGLAHPWPEHRKWAGPYIGAMARSPASVWPGSKMPECNVWLGVLNTADLDKVRARFAAIPWRTPNAVQLFLMDQEQSFFRLWMLRDGELQEILIPGPGENDDDFWSQ